VCTCSVLRIPNSLDLVKKFGLWDRLCCQVTVLKHSWVVRQVVIEPRKTPQFEFVLHSTLFVSRERFLCFFFPVVFFLLVMTRSSTMLSSVKYFLRHVWRGEIQERSFTKFVTFKCVTFIRQTHGPELGGFWFTVSRTSVYLLLGNLIQVEVLELYLWLLLANLTSELLHVSGNRSWNSIQDW
jgi:hypothetical protein